jgi:S-disulfanyl-L-cysteine oxidoreductase SoxD
MNEKSGPSGCMATVAPSAGRHYSCNAAQPSRNPGETFRGHAKTIEFSTSPANVEALMRSRSHAASRKLHLRIALTALVCGGLVSIGSSARAADASGWFTQEQAQRGHQFFNNYCAECHRPDLKGAEGPALIGDRFLKKWGNKPLGNLFTFEHSKMPATDPGSLPEDTVWTITAFILKENGFPAGPTSLNQETGAKRPLVR